MPRTPHADFIEQARAEASKRIILLRVNISDTPDASGEGDLYLTNQTTNVDYYETNDGVHSARTYQPFPFLYRSISSNMDGDVDEAQVSISNVSREIEAYIENRDMQGRTVTIREVFRDALTEPTAHIEEVMTVDEISSDAEMVTFSLTSGLDVQHLSVPRRRYMRVCGHIYKGRGCWIDNGDGTYSEPTGFSLEHLTMISAEFRDRGNNLRAKAKFTPVRASSVSLVDDQLRIDLKKSATGTVVATSGIIISSHKKGTTDYIEYTDLSGLGIGTSYATEIINLSDFSETGTFDKDNVQYVEVYVSGGGGDLKMYVKDVQFTLVSPAPWTDGSEDFCRYTFDDCIRHNNTGRFGGFPGIPNRGRFRV